MVKNDFKRGITEGSETGAVLIKYDYIELSFNFTATATSDLQYETPQFYLAY